MSVLNELRDLETRISARLAELEPLVEEYRELLGVAERLGFDASAAPPAEVAQATSARRPQKTRRQSAARSRKQPAAPRRSARRRVGGTQATGRDRRERVLTLVGAEPGITVRDMSARLGVDAPSLYRVVRKLQNEGAVKKEGTKLQLAS